MADLARIELDDEIARLIRAAQMLSHFAKVVEGGNDQGLATHRLDALGSLLYAEQILSRYRANLEDVRAEYDAKVEGIPG